MKRIPTLQGTRQLYEKYTEEDRQVWKLLFEQQEEQLERFASSAYLDGLVRIGFHANAIPSFERTNSILRETTGWELVAVPGIVDDRKFFELMSKKQFPATTWLRKMEELDYLEEPDMFHDVFAHVPLLADQHFADFLHALSVISLDYIDNPVAIELLSRIYWYTVEFGLIRENGKLR
ncbi:MAG: phenylalanine-4-hydroxylase, partial [Cyclobacteriaceae bacterium]